MKNKTDKRIHWWVPFTLLMVAELYAELVRWDYPLFHAIVKGSIVPLLLAIYLRHTGPNWSRIRIIFSLGLVASWLGDLFLLREDDTFFSLGLFAFLIAHLAYAWSFSKAHFQSIQIPLAKKYPLFIIGAFALGVLMFLLFYPHLHHFLLPVAFYIVAILVMVLSALSRYGRTNNKSFLWVFVGALLFLISDSILGFNKFVQPLPWVRIWIMATYMGAQAAFVQGMILHKRH